MTDPTRPMLRTVAADSMSGKRSRSRWKIALAVSIPMLGAGVFLHTSAGRALLGASGGCPWGGKPPSAERIEDFRVKNAAQLKANARAAARPAFGFTLDKSTRADVTAWGESVGARCTEELGGAALRCEAGERGIRSAGPRADEPAVRDAFFRFDPKGVLVGVDLMRDGTDSAKAASVMTSISAEIARDAGPPSNVRGAASPSQLTGYLDRAATEFRFADYAADVSATNMGAQGVIVREQYRSIPNG